jgi:hypothetical protein
MANMLLLRMEQRLELTLCNYIGERSGDIPLFSLHRIKTLLRKKPIGIGSLLTKILTHELIKQNSIYKAESGNDWSCLTGLNCTNAIENVDNIISDQIEVASNVATELRNQLAVIIQKMKSRQTAQIKKIKAWFEANYYDLIYEQDKKIPWSVVQALRRNLAAWTVNSTNPFDEKIDDMVMEVAREQGISASTAEEAWIKMGGKIFPSWRNKND